MARRKRQADFRVEVKTELLKREMSISQLAASLGRPRSTVSQAINRQRFPRVRREITNRLQLHHVNVA